MRYLNPLIFAAATASMWYYNGTNDSSKLLLPFIDLLYPEMAGDPVALAARSVEIGVMLTCVILFYTIVGHIRAIRTERQTQALQADDE